MILSNYPVNDHPESTWSSAFSLEQLMLGFLLSFDLIQQSSFLHRLGIQITERRDGSEPIFCFTIIS